jgi:hypothetical protein
MPGAAVVASTAGDFGAIRGCLVLIFGFVSLAGLAWRLSCLYPGLVRYQVADGVHLVEVCI